MSLGWSQPEAIEMKNSRPWYQRGLVKELGVRCKYCESLFRKKRSAFNILRVLPIAGLVAAINYIDFDRYKYLYAVLFIIWVMLLIVQIGRDQLEEV